jgi:hypothetical protein
MYGYGKKELKAFADGFDKVLAKLLKEPGPPVKKAT